MSAVPAARPRVPARRPWARGRLVLLTLEAQCLDGVTFCLAVHAAGVRGESNMLMAGLYHDGGLGAVLAVKAIGALAAALLVTRAPGRWALLPAAAGLVGAITNLLA
jgi:hypothetical protein